MNGIGKVSSKELAARIGLTSSQVRADLNLFEGAGQQGYGYNVKRLYTEISRYLAAGDGMTAVIIGGSDATAELLATRCEGRGVTVTGHFSEDEGSSARPYHALVPFLAEHPTDLVLLLTIPASMPTLPDQLTAHGVKGIWNLTQSDLVLNIPVLNLPIGDILMSLCCDIRAQKREEKEKTDGVHRSL
jgi:redox-sensing transcriptional repressor